METCRYPGQSFSASLVIERHMAKKKTSSGITSSDMYKAARTSRDIEVLASGDPKKIVRRAKNKL